MNYNVLTRQIERVEEEMKLEGEAREGKQKGQDIKLRCLGQAHRTPGKRPSHEHFFPNQAHAQERCSGSQITTLHYYKSVTHILQQPPKVKLSARSGYRALTKRKTSDP